jgi:hypothetical protein
MLGALQVRLVPAALLPQITGSNFSMYSACHVYYYSRKKKYVEVLRLDGSGGCGRLQMATLDQSPMFLIFLALQFVVDLPYYL